MANIGTFTRDGDHFTGAGYGGHFRAVQGFRYLGDATCG